jgi:peptide/nickel transport system substrate-binding protein
VGRSGGAFRGIGLTALVAILVTACAPAAPAARSPDAGESAPSAAQGRKKVLNLGLRTILDGFSIAGSGSLAGGGLGYIEIHSQALFSSDKATGRPVPRLLAEQPTLENSGLQLGADGKMVSIYRLRPDLRWADGHPLTSRDLLFTYNLTRDRTLPVVDPSAAELMESATAPDDLTFRITWKQPYYLADAIGLQLFWPLPAHLLEADYMAIVSQQKDVQAFMAKPYWTSEYVHVGPYRLVEFTAGVEAVFEAVDHYFLGRPKVDRIVVKQFADPNTLYANIISGGIDLSTDNALPIEQGVQLKQTWDGSDGGAVWYATGPTWFVAFQFDASVPNFQNAVLDRGVRQALYSAIDRETYSEAVLAGIPGRAAHALLSPDHALHPSVKDGWKQRYPYDPNRATATFEQAGWRRGADGLLANAAGGRVHLDTRTTAGQERKLSVIGDMWRKVGAEVEEIVIPAARVRDREYRQMFPAAEITARGNEETVFSRLECALSPTPQNSFSGNNRGHWCNGEFDRLVSQFRATLREQDRGPIARQIQDVVVEELPILLLNYEVSVVLARKGVTAFHDDFAGGADSGRAYGTYSRNAHEWDSR